MPSNSSQPRFTLAAPLDGPLTPEQKEAIIALLDDLRANTAPPSNPSPDRTPSTKSTRRKA
jgi:hypothetical protein